MNLNSQLTAARYGSVALLAVLAALPLCASAGPAPLNANPGFYFGGGAGYNRLNGEDYTGSGDNLNDKRMTYKGLAGFRLNPNVSLEGQYLDFGTAEDGDNRVDAHGVTAGVVVEAAGPRYLHPYAKAGVLFWDADSRFSNVSRNDDGTDFTYGAGVRFVANSRLDFRTEYERFEFNDNRVGNLTATLQFNF